MKISIGNEIRDIELEPEDIKTAEDIGTGMIGMTDKLLKAGILYETILVGLSVFVMTFSQCEKEFKSKGR